MSNNLKKFDPLKNYWSVNLMEAEPLIIDVLKAGWVPNLISSPGLGKSALIAQIAERLNLCLIDIRLSQMAPEDLNGFPAVIDVEIEVNGKKQTIKNGKKQTIKKATYIPMDVFPIPGQNMPINPKTGKQYNGWLLFLDEFNSATPAVQVAAYKIVLDKMVGMHKLHPRCVIATAGNLMTDKAIVQRSSTATQSRIVHFAIKADNDAWELWAANASIDHRVISFLKWKPDMLHNFDPNHTDLTFPCPRTWEMVSDCIKSMETIPFEKRPLLAGCVGIGAAQEFYGYTEVFKNLPQFEDILRDPDDCPMSIEPATQYALAGMIGSKMTVETADECVRFLQRLGADFQVTALRQAIGRVPELYLCKPVKQWKRLQTQELIRNKS